MDKQQIEKIKDKISIELIPYSYSLSDYLEVLRELSEWFKLQIALAEIEMKDNNNKEE